MKFIVTLFLSLNFSLAQAEIAYERAIKVVCIDRGKAFDQVGATDSIQHFMDPAGNKWMILQKPREVIIVLVAKDKPEEACFVSYGDK